jgi:hypothetical protein
MVLVASVLMPFLMHWTTLTIALEPLPLPLQTPESLWPLQTPMPEPPQSSSAPEFSLPVAARGELYPTVNWLVVATAVYAGVAGILLLRLGAGICLTWRLTHAAKPMRESWTANASVRVSHVIGAPVTFGSTILLPPQCADWDLFKRRAVLAHEGAHVANRDFYVLLLASLNRAVFWFSPFAWWQLNRLAELAEIISDANALEVLEDRPSYAQILLDLVQHVQRAPAALEMARACTVHARIERILAATPIPAKAGWRQRAWAATATLPVVIISAATIAYGTPPASTRTIDAADATTTAVRNKPQLVDFYLLGRTSIFAVFREGDDLFGQLSGQRKLRLANDGHGSYSYQAVAGEITLALNGEQPPSELTVSQNGREMRAARIAEMSWQVVADDPAHLDSYVGWYQLTPSRVLTVTRDGDRMHVQETGRSKFEVTANGVDGFSSNHDDLVIFLRDDQANVTQVLLQDPLYGARLAPRVDGATARKLEDEFARRIARVPDRFREQTPASGSKEAVLKGIADMQRGAPNYDRMSASLAAKIRPQASQLQAMFKALGAVESIFFRGVGPGGYDIYGVKFANGFAEFRLLLRADGKADDVIFRPDGNDAPGGVMACSEEPGLRARDETAPIRLLLYNGSGKDLQLYGLDAGGKRTVARTIGDNMTSPILTYVDSPWVVADSSGKCLQIVLPGQRTRFHTVEASQPIGPPESLPPRRSAPLAGSEEMLRQYIEAMRRGEPNYNRMTAEVAAQTRQQLALNQAILGRLGELRALSFRGVSGFGSDIYIAHFANGSAEWRIGLVKDGTIGRLALGPQY